MLSAYSCKSGVSTVLLPARGVKVFEDRILVVIAHDTAQSLHVHNAGMCRDCLECSILTTGKLSVQSLEGWEGVICNSSL